MKLACADFTFPLLAHDGVLKLIGLLNFQGVDIGLFEGRSHLWPSKQFANVQANGHELKHKLEDQGIEAADVFLQMDADFTPYAINHPQNDRRTKARDWFERTLEYAAALGCHHVTTLPGVAFEGEDRDQSFGRSCDELAWRVEQARRAQIVFGIEAHVGSIVEQPAEVLQLVQCVPGLTLTVDYTHFTRCGIADSQVEPLLAYASHFHVRGARLGRLQTTFKDNTIGYQRIVDLLGQHNYRGWLGIEYVWIDWEHCNECDNLSETILFRDLFRSHESL